MLLQIANNDCDHYDRWYSTKEEIPVVNRSICGLLLITILLGTKLIAGLIHLTKFVSLLVFCLPHSISVASFPRQWSVQMDIIP